MIAQAIKLDRPMNYEVVKRKVKPRQKIKTRVLAKYFNVDTTTINRNIRQGNRYDLLYCILTKEDLTRRQKKTFVFNTSMSLEMKNAVWNRYLETTGIAS